MSAPPAPGLPERLTRGTASEAECEWALRRLSVLRDNREAVGLTRAEEWELFGLELLVGAGAHG